MNRRLGMVLLAALGALGLDWLMPAMAQPSPRLYLPALQNGGSIVQPQDITIIEIIPGSRDEPEFVTLFKNVDTPINIGGWQVINSSRADRPTYTFPSYVVDDDNVVILYTQPGQRDPLIGDFFWGRSDYVWRPGDRAELRDATGQLIHTYTVLNPGEAPPSPTATTTPTSTPLGPTATAAPTSTPLVPSVTVMPPGSSATAAPTRTPQPATPTRNPAVCAPEYPTVCIPPPPPDLNCDDIPHRHFAVLPPDRHNFDRDADGIGCERG